MHNDIPELSRRGALGALAATAAVLALPGAAQALTVADARNLIDRDGYATKIVAASFKNVTQVNDALDCGAHAVTVAPALLRSALGSPLVEGAVRGFDQDFARFHPNGLLDALKA